MQKIQRELFGLGSPLFSLSYQTRLGFLFLLVLSVRQPTVITALSMLILIDANINPNLLPEKFGSLMIDLDGLNGTLSNADGNDDFDAALFGIDVIYQRLFSLLLSPVEPFIPHKKVIIRPRDKWMTGQIRQAIRKRDRLENLFQT